MLNTRDSRGNDSGGRRKTIAGYIRMKPGEQGHTQLERGQINSVSRREKEEEETREIAKNEIL